MYLKFTQNPQVEFSLKPPRFLSSARASGCRHTFYHTYQSLNAAGLIDPNTMQEDIQLFKDLFDDSEFPNLSQSESQLGEESDTIEGMDSDSVFGADEL